MKEITFQEVGMENFGPYIDPMVLTFENDKLTLITGPNGIGKTMSLEAIPFTLFGETCKKAKGDDVVNTRVGKDCHTWVRFSIDNDKYLVERYHKYSKLGNTVTISKNGEDPYKKGHREVLPEVEKLICSKKSFTNTLMFGQKVKDFFTDLVDSDKKEIFRKILDLDIYTEWYKQADLDLKEIKTLLQKSLEGVGISTGILDDIEEQILVIEKQMADFENIKQEKIRDIKKSIEDQTRMIERWQTEKDSIKLDDDITSVQEKIDNLKQELTSNENEKQMQLIKLNNGRDSKLSELRESASSVKSEVSKELKDKYESFQASNKQQINEIEKVINALVQSSSEILSKISACEAERKHIQKSIDKLNDSLELEGGACPVCLRTIDDECKSHLENEVQKLIEEYQKLEKKEKSYSDELDDIRKKVETERIKRGQQDEEYTSFVYQLKDEEKISTQEIDEKLSEAIEKVKKLADLESEKINSKYVKLIEDIKNSLVDLETSKQLVIKTQEKLSEIDATINNLKQAISNHEIRLKMEEESVYDTSQLKLYKSRKIEIKQKIANLNKKIDKLTEEESLSMFWKSAWSPSGIPSMLIDEAIPFMNEKVSEYLDRLTNGRYIVSFDTLAETKAGEFRDKISVNVLDTYTRANSRIQLSGGQTRLVDIATILTLGDLQSAIQDLRINILLFDEIFDSLDEENIGFVSKILGQLKIGKSIYLISHTQVDQLEADEILEFK